MPDLTPQARSGTGVSSPTARRLSTRTLWIIAMGASFLALFTIGLTVQASVRASLTVVVADDLCKAAAALIACAICVVAAVRGQKRLRIAWGSLAVSTFLWGSAAVVES